MTFCGARLRPGWADNGFQVLSKRVDLCLFDGVGPFGQLHPETSGYVNNGMHGRLVADFLRTAQRREPRTSDEQPSGYRAELPTQICGPAVVNLRVTPYNESAPREPVPDSASDHLQTAS